MHLRGLIILSMLLFASPGRAWFESVETRWELVGGALNVPLQKVTVSSDASPSLFGEMYLPLGARLEIVTAGGWSMRPGLLTTLIPLFPRKSPDQALTKDFHILDWPFLFPRSDAFAWKAGAALYLYEMKGSGGTKDLNNGGGVTTFKLPGRTQSAKLFALDGGASWTVNGNHFDLDLISFGFFSNERRTFLLMFSFGVPL